MIWGGRWEGSSGLGSHVHSWLIHVNVWQNQYSIVKQNKVKIKIFFKKGKEIMTHVVTKTNLEDVMLNEILLFSRSVVSDCFMTP